MRRFRTETTLARPFSRLAFAVVLTVAGAAAALAHAHLDHSVPAAGSTVPASLSQVQIVLSEAVEPAFSTIEVTDPKGKRVDQGKASVDPANAKSLSVAVKPLTAGTYQVVWSVVSVDTHKSNGSFAFTVAP